MEEREGRKEFSTAESGEYEKRLKDNFYLIFYWMLHHLINMFFIVYHIFIYSYIHIIIIIKNNTKWYGKDVNSNLSMKLKKWQKEIRNTSEVKLDIFEVLTLIIYSYIHIFTYLTEKNKKHLWGRVGYIWGGGGGRCDTCVIPTWSNGISYVSVNSLVIMISTTITVMLGFRQTKYMFDGCLWNLFVKLLIGCKSYFYLIN